MPLKTGSSPKTKSDNISELMHAYQHSGKIGETVPRNRKHALEIAVAIASQKARDSK